MLGVSTPLPLGIAPSLWCWYLVLPRVKVIPLVSGTTIETTDLIVCVSIPQVVILEPIRPRGPVRPKATAISDPDTWAFPSQNVFESPPGLRWAVGDPFIARPNESSFWLSWSPWLLLVRMPPGYWPTAVRPVRISILLLIITRIAVCRHDDRGVWSKKRRTKGWDFISKVRATGFISSSNANPKAIGSVIRTTSLIEQTRRDCLIMPTVYD